MIFTMIQVAIGGALGAVARYLTGLAALRVLGAGFPWGTFAVNVTGSFVMGIVCVMVMDSGSARYSPFLMSGVLGGFTTFSAFSLDAIALYERGAHGLAAIYVVTSVVVSLIALMMGLWVARGMIQ